METEQRIELIFQLLTKSPTYNVIRGLIASSLFSPIPFISNSCSLEKNCPFLFLHSKIRVEYAGPIPGNSCNFSAEAVFMFINELETSFVLCFDESGGMVSIFTSIREVPANCTSSTGRY